MSSATETESNALSPTRETGFLRARMGSLLAVLPLGVWTVNHLWNNLAAFQGAEAWQVAVTEHPHPVAQLFTAILVLLPLFLHTVWGIGRLFAARPNNARYGFYFNFKYVVQRLSAIGLALFLGAHLWLAMLKPRLATGRPEAFAAIAHEMRFHGPTLVVYLLGTLGLAYHLANGLQTFAMGWGILGSKRAIRGAEPVVIGIFLVLLAMGWGAIYAIWSAGV